MRQRTMRAARRTRQTGKPFVGETAGQVADLAGSHPLILEKGFPAPSSGSPSTMSPAAHHEGDTTEPASMTCDQLMSHYFLLTPEFDRITLHFAYKDASGPRKG